MLSGLGSSKGMEGGGDASPPFQSPDFPRQIAFPSHSPHVHMARNRQNPEDGRPCARPSTELGVCPSPLRGALLSRLHVCFPRAALRKGMEVMPLESMAIFSQCHVESSQELLSPLLCQTGWRLEACSPRFFVLIPPLLLPSLLPTRDPL